MKVKSYGFDTGLKNKAEPIQPRFNDVCKELKKVQKGDYSEYVAGLLSVISGWSYANIEDFMEIMNRIGVRPCGAEIKMNNDSMFICSTVQVLMSKDYTIICFRGTELINFVNTLTDVNVKTAEWPTNERIEIHGGFLRNFQAVWPGIVDFLKKKKPKGKLFITGHSLGAAMAIIAGMSIYEYTGSEPFFKKLKQQLHGVYTYGAPMAMKRTNQFKDTFGELDKMIFRHVYYSDIVPQMPPMTAGCFMHVGVELRVNKDKKWEVSVHESCQAPLLLLSAGVAITAWIFKQLPVVSKIPLPFSAYDHSPLRYISISVAKEISELWGWPLNTDESKNSSEKSPEQ